MAGDGGKGNGKGGGKGGAIKLAAGALAGLPVMLLVVMLLPVIVVVSLLAQAQSARACVEGHRRGWRGPRRSRRTIPMGIRSRTGTRASTMTAHRWCGMR